MGKLIYLMNVSLDGFVETPDHSLDWSIVDEELHTWFNDQTRGVEASLYGRRLWEVMAAYWPTGEDNPSSTDVEREFARIWNAMPKVVFSTTLEHVEHNARLVHGEVGTILADLRREFDGDLGVGGPNLAGQFVRRGLVDEYRLVVHPVALGAGTPFWPDVEAPLHLRPVEKHVFSSGVELRTYVPA
ncbi:MAG: dihydrofolate reductase family protein [Candidatus Limnocylindria bacterium]